MILRIVLLLLFTCSAAYAQTADDIRVREISASLRCIVCEGQSLADSQADIAIEMRNIIRQKVAAGENNEAILHYFTERYGDAILTSPPVKRSTLPLWLAPVALLAIGLLLIRRMHS